MIIYLCLKTFTSIDATKKTLALGMKAISLRPIFAMSNRLPMSNAITKTERIYDCKQHSSHSKR